MREAIDQSATCPVLRDRAFSGGEERRLFCLAPDHAHPTPDQWGLIHDEVGRKLAGSTGEAVAR